MKEIEYLRAKKEILRPIMEEFSDLRGEICDLQKEINNILEQAQKQLCESHDLVIIYDGVDYQGINKIKVYEKGVDTTKGIIDIHITPDKYPTIQKEIFGGDE